LSGLSPHLPGLSRPQPPRPARSTSRPPRLVREREKVVWAGGGGPAGGYGLLYLFLFFFLSFLFSLFCKHLNSNFIYNFDFSTLSFLFEFDLQIQFSKLVHGRLGQERMVSMIILGRYIFLIFSKISRANFS
jgi:hypothetical protein